MKRLVAVAAAVLLFGCGQPQQTSDVGEPGSIADDAGPEEAGDETVAELAPVDPGLLNAPNSTFVAIEPSEVGIFAASSVEEAIAPLLGPEALEEGATIQMSVRDVDGMRVADVVRADIPDDSVAAGHVRIEFRQEPEGWFPTNAYRRLMCRRGERANQWTTEICP